MYNFNKFKIKEDKNISTGFTLIEIMVAIMILGVSFVGIIQAFPFAIKIINSAKNQTRSSYYAQEKIEELYQLGYSNIATGTIEVKHPIGATSTIRSQFKRETTVSYVGPDLIATTTDLGLKSVNVSIFYTNGLSKNEDSFELSTIISSR